MENQEFSQTRNPMEYLKIFFRRKWLFIAPIFAGLVLGISASLIMPPKYESSTTILIEEEKIINPLIQNLAVSSTAAQRMQNIREIILGWNSLVELTKKLDLAKNIQNQSQFEGLIKGLRDVIDVRMRKDNIIQISYSNQDPIATEKVTRALTDILMERNIAAQTKETNVAITFIQEQLQIYKRKIKESEIATLDEELKKLLVDSTEMHPLVRELRQKITIARKELDSGEYEVGVSEQPLASAAEQALKKELDSMISKEVQAITSSGAQAEQAPRDQSQNIYKLLLMDKVGASRAQDIDVNKKIYQMLLERLETARITQRLEASKEGTRYNVIDPPRVPLKPKNGKIKIILFGFLLGAASGTGLVFGREFLDNSFLDIEDAKNNLQLPVLGAISRLTTIEEIESEKQREKKWILIALVSGFLLILLSMLVSFLRK